MEIYVVQTGDTIHSIAEKFGVAAQKIVQDNGLNNPNSLVIGQTLVIAYPSQTYTVKEGDTLKSIADAYNVSFLRLLQNNPFLSDRDYIYPGEDLVISYNTNGAIATNGIAYAFIKRETLLKALPYLTYLSVYNYRAAEKGEIITYNEDNDIVQAAKDYGVIPLMMVSTLTIQGEPNIEIAYSILSNSECQDKYIDNILSIMKDKGYQGINLVFNIINSVNQVIYEKLIKKVSNRIKQEGFLCFVTINPSLENIDGKVIFERIDYSGISDAVNGIMFLKFVWGTNYGPPSPVSNIRNIKALLDYVLTMVSPDKIIIADPVVSYDWQLPYKPGESSAYSLTIDSAINVAEDAEVAIQFDETSQTPFFEYHQINIAPPYEHIVWSLDARSINALENTVKEYALSGIGYWNIMVNFPQLWLLIYTQYDIIKY